MAISKQILNVVSMLFYCWPSVVDDGPTLKQHWLNGSCLLGYKGSPYMPRMYVKLRGLVKFKKSKNSD